MAENVEQRGEQCVRTEKELPIAFGNFTSKENWDFFYAARGAGNFSEWYADWPQLRTLLRNHLSFPPSAPPPEELSILVPACGNSRLSEHLYDDGFRNITNVDFSREVISAMMKRNLRERPGMRWRVMDMTDMQFASGTVDAIIDKGGLDALMEPNIDPRLGTIYLSEAKRLLKAGGKYICLTLAESHVVGLLFRKFRFGWKVNLYAVAQEPSSGTTKQRAFMLVAEKFILTVRELFEALDRENTVREEYSNGTDTWLSLNDLNQGVQGNIGVLEPGRAVNLFLGETGVSRFFYSGLLLDAHPLPISFSDQYHVIFLHSMQMFHNLLVSTTRPWRLVGGQNTARLLIVVLDANHNVLANEIENDIFRLIKQLAPGDDIENANVGVTHADLRYKQKKTLYKVTSTLTGPIAVEDVIYFNTLGDIPNTYDKSKDFTFRRLRFGRTEVFAQSEALLSTQVQNKKVQAKKGKLRMVESQPSDSQEASSGDMKVDHKYVRSGLTKGMISGLLLFSIHSKRTTSAGRLVKTVIIGLGAGLLPMCMRNYVPTLKIEVVESDPVVLNVAKEYFGFEEDDGLKVHITDAMKFVKERANSDGEGKNSSKIDVLIIEVDSSDSSSGLISPEAEFVEEPFLLAAKDSLSDKGLLIVKFVTCYTGVRAAVYSNFEKVFSNLFCLHTDKGFNELIFALKKDSPFIGEEELAQACEALRRSLEHNNGDWVKQALVDSKKIEPLRKS
ncbi:hypothetical protein MIMGU_mgv1a001980mg [Erythranthe guttata]|uniref:Methyltransferase type 11 domain-containing protein n=1 Tax=Erythranthe guttata TaxID=4155 RepID=A0A022QZE2_ERYGU|nr:hypothetical protein MIMGU_mgv1a001980mg [Erythranthe guttata]